MTRGRQGTVDFGRRTILFRRAGLALRWDLRAAVVCGILGLAVLVVAVAGVATGDFPLGPGKLWGALIDRPGSGFDRIVVVEWRMPRVLAAIVFGAALAVSGAVFQSLTRNPLASPDVIGFSTGSYTGALVVIIVMGGTYLQTAAGALVGGILTAAAVYLLAWRGGVQGFRLIIVGIGVGAMLASLNTWLILTADLDLAMNAAAWGAGSLAGTTWEQVLLGALVVTVLLAALGVFVRGLRQLELGDDAARATGVRAEHVRVWTVIVGVALTATVTAAAGPIAFVSLAAPQIARRIVRSAGITVVPAAFTGALLLVVADYAAQHLLPTALPVGVVTVVFGGGYLVWLLVHEMRRRA